jgi:nickel/cobalt transporter (NicO) family protein
MSILNFATSMSDRLQEFINLPGITPLAFVFAFLAGAGHAVAPGHGKTLAAAYLAGSRGRIRDAAWLGGSVAAMHTVSVLVIGVAWTFLSLSDLLRMEELTTWLEVAAGLLVLATGLWMLRRHLRGDHHHHHGPGGHTHGPLGHSHGSDGHAHGSGGHAHGSEGHAHGAGSRAGSVSRGPAPADSHETVRAHEHEAAPSSVLVLKPAPVSAEEPEDNEEAGRGGEPGQNAEPTHGHEHSHEHGHHSHEHGDDHEHGHHSHERGDDHGHGHGHGDHGHGHKHEHAGAKRPGLFLLGISGGLTPSPAAFFVLATGLFLGRAAFALLLVLTFGIGMAVVLFAVGVLAVAGSSLVTRNARSHGILLKATRFTPLLAAAGITIFGAGMIVFAAVHLSTLA